MLTARQQQVLHFIEQHRSATGLSPTVREIGRGLGLSSSSTVSAHLVALEKAGAIRRIPGGPRSVQPVNNMARCSECDGPLTIGGSYCPHCGVQL